MPKHRKQKRTAGVERPPQVSHNRRREKRGETMAEPKRYDRPFTPLFKLPQAEQVRAPEHRCLIGCSLPLRAGGIEPMRAKNLKDVFKVANNNGQALLRLVEKLRDGKHKLHTTQAYSINDIIYVTLSDLLGTKTSFLHALSYGGMQDLVNTIRWHVQTAIRGAKRLVLLNDMAHDPATIRFLSMLYLHDNWNNLPPFKRIMLSLSRLETEYPGFVADYRHCLNPLVFQVVNDVTMTHEDVSKYLTWCMTHQMPFNLQLNCIEAFDTAQLWLKAEKKRLFQAIRPLIIIDRQMQMKISNVDRVLAHYMPLTKYTDVLIRTNR